MAIVSYTLNEIKKMIRRGEDKSDWKKLRRAMKDDSLIDYSDIPPTTDEMIKNVRRPGHQAKEDKKESVSLRFDSK
ncbi:MAG: hypothetical protein FWH53_04350 [Leptospirales bacterium]|nr:hypothetical protein [Leptospirales bacterium]